MLTKLLRYIVMSSSAILLVHCGPGGEVDNDSAKSRFKNKANAVAVQKNLSVQCDKQEDCPEYLAALVGLRELKENSSSTFEVYGCSGTLIKKDQLLTNRHCLPNINSQVGDSCDGLKISFAQTDISAAENIECKEVVAISEHFNSQTVDQPDWVVIRLKNPSSRQIAKTNNVGVPAFQRLTTYPVNFSIIGQDENKNMYARIQKNECIARMDHLVSVKYNHPQSYMLAGTCQFKVVNGNSGTALFNENLELLGLMNAGIQKASAKNNSTYYFGKNINFPQLSFLGNNIHCISYFNQSRNTACDYNQYSYSDNIGEEMSKMHAHYINEEQRGIVDSYIKSSDSVQWEEHQSSFIRSIFIDRSDKEVQRRSEAPSYFYAKEYATRQIYPYTPKCVNLNYADKGIVSFMLPIMLQDKKMSFVSKDNFYSIPLYYEEIPMLAEYDSAKMNFRVRIDYPELTEEQEKTWLNKRTNLINQYNTCVTAKSAEICETYAQLENSFNSWLDSIGITVAQRNAIELQINNQLLDEVDIPESYVDSCNN